MILVAVAGRLRSDCRYLIVGCDSGGLPMAGRMRYRGVDTGAKEVILVHLHHWDVSFWTAVDAWLLGADATGYVYLCVHSAPVDARELRGA